MARLGDLPSCGREARHRVHQTKGGGARRSQGPRTGAALHRHPVRVRCARHDQPWTASRTLPAPVRARIPAAGRTGNSETDIVVPISGGVPVAIRGTHVPRIVVPRAATQHPAFMGRSGSRTSPAEPPDDPKDDLRRGRRARRETVRAADGGYSRAGRAPPSSPRAAAPLRMS